MKKIYKSFIMALSMFTIIPTPYIEWDDESSKNMMKFYPLIGLIIGLIWSLVYIVITFINCSLILKSSILMIVPFCLSGMLHLDGYMDVCDAILSRREKAEKLRILKDSKIGAFAVVALIMLFFLQFGGVHSFLEKNYLDFSFITFSDGNIMSAKFQYLFKMGSPIYMLLLIPVVSRSLAGYFLLSKITIKESSLGTYFKKGTNNVDIFIMIFSIIIAAVLSIILLDFKVILVSLAMILAAKLSVDKCIKEFGGVSGDVAGFVLVVAECIGIVVCGII